MTNKVTKYGFTIIAAVLLIAVLGAGVVSADVPDGMTGSNWMSFLPDTASIGELNIPGSYESGAYHVDGGKNAASQDLTPVKQFDAGCRWFYIEYGMRTGGKGATVDGVKIKDLTDGNGKGKDVHVLSHYGGYCYLEEGTAFISVGEDKMMLFEHLINDLSAKVAGTKETVFIALEPSALIAEEDLDDIVIDQIKQLTGMRPNHFAWRWDNKDGFDDLTLGDLRGKVVFVFHGHYSKTVPPYMNADYATEDTRTTEKTIATLQGYLSPVWNNATYQNLSQQRKLNASTDPAIACPVVSFTNCLSGNLAAEENFIADEIASGRFYNFEKGKNYGVVIFNYIDNEASKKIYELNFFETETEKPLPTTLFTYNGSLQSPIAPGVGYTLSGNVSAINVSKYTVTVSVNVSQGYIWSDGTTDPVTYEWEIVPYEVLQPELNRTTCSYSGTVQSVELVDTADVNYYDSDGNFSATNVGTYTVNVYLTDKNNTVWATTNTTANLTLPWSIISTAVGGELPKLNQTRITYTGSTIEVNVTNTTLYKVEANYKAVGVGIYLAQVNVTAGYSWNDGHVGPVYLPWMIVPRNISVPELNQTQFIYNGSVQTVTLDPEQSENYSIIKGGSAVAADTYKAVVALKDPKNNSWKLDTGLRTKIPRILFWEILPYVETIPTLNATTYKFDETTHAVTTVPATGNFTVSGNLTGRNATTYLVDIGLTDKVNYTWFGGSRLNTTLSWNITPLEVTRPTITGRVQEYDGNVKSLTLTPDERGANVVVDNDQATNPGVYLANVSLLEPGNRIWSDNKSTETIKVPWMIRKDNVTINYLVNNASLGSVDVQTETITKGSTAKGSTATANTSGDNVFLYWNRSVGPIWDEDETYVTLKSHITPQILPFQDGVLNYFPTNYTAVFSPVKMDLGQFYQTNSSKFLFGIHEGTLTNRASDVVSGINLRLITNVNETVAATSANATVYRNDKSVTTSIPAPSGYTTSKILSIFNVTADATTPGSTMTFVVMIHFNDATTASTNVDNVRFWHYNSSTGWETTPLTSSYVLAKQIATYTVQTSSFSPIGITIIAPASSSSSGGSSSHHSGGSLLLRDDAVLSNTMCMVNFSMNGHGTQVTNQSVQSGSTAHEPSPAPTAVGYSFNGWYTDSSLSSKFDFNTQITDDTVLYARWTPSAPAASSTTQPTQQSPAPLAGLIAGLGVAALVYRLRR